MTDRGINLDLGTGHFQPFHVTCQKHVRTALQQLAVKKELSDIRSFWVKWNNKTAQARPTYIGLVITAPGSRSRRSSTNKSV
jgi:hypothetical protein